MCIYILLYTSTRHHSLPNNNIITKNWLSLLEKLLTNEFQVLQVIYNVVGYYPGLYIRPNETMHI